MKSLLFRLALAAAILMMLSPTGYTELVVLNLQTTGDSATPISGANYNGTNIVQTGDPNSGWGTEFKDYQFTLTNATSIPFYYLQVVLLATRQNSAAGYMGVTAWAGSSNTNASNYTAPVFSNAIWNAAVSYTDITLNGFSTNTFGPSNSLTATSTPIPGLLSPTYTISTNPSVFWFRVWGTGDKNVQGFKGKFAAAPAILITNDPGPTPTPTPFTPAVPEPGTWATAGLLLLAAGYMCWRRRAQTA